MRQEVWMAECSREDAHQTNPTRSIVIHWPVRPATVKCWTMSSASEDVRNQNIYRTPGNTHRGNHTYRTPGNTYRGSHCEDSFVAPQNGTPSSSISVDTYTREVERHLYQNSDMRQYPQQPNSGKSPVSTNRWIKMWYPYHGALFGQSGMKY